MFQIHIYQISLCSIHAQMLIHFFSHCVALNSVEKTTWHTKAQHSFVMILCWVRPQLQSIVAKDARQPAKPSQYNTIVASHHEC